MAAYILCLLVPAADCVQYAPPHLQDALQGRRFGKSKPAILLGTLNILLLLARKDALMLSHLLDSMLAIAPALTVHPSYLTGMGSGTKNDCFLNHT